MRQQHCQRDKDSPRARFCACIVSASSAFFSRANRPAALARWLATPPAWGRARRQGGRGAAGVRSGRCKRQHEQHHLRASMEKAGAQVEHAGQGSDAPALSWRAWAARQIPLPKQLPLPPQRPARRRWLRASAAHCAGLRRCRLRAVGAGARCVRKESETVCKGAGLHFQNRV